jgi:hypothetical protein
MRWSECPIILAMRRWERPTAKMGKMYYSSDGVVKRWYNHPQRSRRPRCGSIRLGLLRIKDFVSTRQLCLGWGGRKPSCAKHGGQTCRLSRSLVIISVQKQHCFSFLGTRSSRSRTRLAAPSTHRSLQLQRRHHEGVVGALTCMARPGRRRPCHPCRTRRAQQRPPSSQRPRQAWRSGP